MKKSLFLLVILALFTFCFNSAFADNPKISDIEAQNQFKGYRQIINHPYKNLYDIYYKGNSDNAEIKIIELFKNDDEKNITFNYADKTITLTSKQWFNLFNNFSAIKSDNDALSKISTDFFSEWIYYYMNSSPKEIAQKYIKDKQIEAERIAKQKELDKKYSLLNHSGMKFKNIKTQIEHDRAVYQSAQGAFFEYYQSVPPAIHVDEDINRVLTGYIAENKLKEIGLNALSSFHKESLYQKTIYYGKIRILNKDVNKDVFLANIGKNYDFNEKLIVYANNVRVALDDKKEKAIYNVEDLITQSVITRLFAKDMNGVYIPMPYTDNRTKFQHAMDTVLYNIGL